jgi:mono/diheme cytochrome c family protein
MKTLIKLLVATAVIIIGAVGFAYSGFYDVSASSPHSDLLNWYLSTTSHASVERHANDVLVPGLTDDALIRAGVNDFDAMCVACHGAPGQVPAALGQGLNPPAPDLADSAAQMTPAELFWVTKNGIKMTGMPAWGATHDDDAIWPVVAFMTKLPTLDADRYQSLLAGAAGAGHHADGDDKGGHDHGVTEPSYSSAMNTDHRDAESSAVSGRDDEPATSESDHHDDGHDHEH